MTSSQSVPILSPAAPPIVARTQTADRETQKVVGGAPRKFIVRPDATTDYTSRVEKPLTRRQFTVTGALALASMAIGHGCADAAQSRRPSEPRLTARPRRAAGTDTGLKSGPLGLGSGTRDGVVQMPRAAAEPGAGFPLLVFLHGATQSGTSMLRRLGPTADQLGVVLLAPDSRETTWDAIRGDFAEDVEFLNRALEHVFAQLSVDPSRLAIGGFSDGASYALSLGLANGDLFPKVVACSPGFVMPAPAHGHPQFFFSHGTADTILPIDQCSRVLVPQLRGKGYDVTYREFDGRHEIPPAIAEEALRWMLAV